MTRCYEDQVRVGALVVVKDPADRRRHASGIVQSISSGRGSWYAIVKMSDPGFGDAPMAFSIGEFVRT